MFGLKKRKNKKVLLSEKEILKKLDIPNFRHMTKEKIIDFSSQIPNMEPEVVKTALQQFPHFAKMASEVVTCYKELMGQTLKENAISTKSFYESCDSVIDALKSLLDKDKLKFKQKRVIIDNIMEILKMKNSKDSEQKEWLTNFVKNVSVAAVAIVGVVASIIAANINLKK